MRHPDGTAISPAAASSMARAWPRRRRGVRAFRTDASGAVSVEFVIWLPLVLGMMGLIFDVSMTIFEANRMWDVARDTGRRVAIQNIEIDDAKAFAEAKLSHPMNGSYEVAVSRTNAEDITVDIRLTGAAIRFFGMFPLYPLDDIAAIYTMRSES